MTKRHNLGAFLQPKQILLGNMSQLLKIHFQYYLSNVRLLSSTVAKGIVKPNNPNNQNVDILALNLKDSHTPDDLLSLVATHHTIMNNQHVMQALKTLFTLQKQERYPDSTAKQITSHPSFKHLCSKLKVHAGKISADDALVALKVLTYLNVASNSTIYQTMLQLLRHNINQLSISQIIFLNFLLGKVNKTPISEALQLALPIVFETQVPVKLDMSNIKLLADCLSYASRQNVSRACTELIINALLKHRLNEKVSMGVLWSICNLPPAYYYEPLLKKTLKTLVINYRKLNVNELETSLTKLTYRYSAKYPFYYNQEFFDVCGQRIIEYDVGFEHAVHFLRKVLKTDYFNQAVFNYALGLCHENLDLLKMGDSCHIHSLVCTAALTDYTSNHLDFIKDALITYDVDKFREKENLLRYATSLCVIGIYSPTVLQRVLNVESLSAAYQKRFVHDIQNVILISQLIKTYKPELNYLLPDDESLRAHRTCVKLSNDFPLEGLLHKVFGGENFVRTDVFSKMHHFIDHIIVLRKGGLPVPVTKHDEELEDIRVDSSSQMILIVVLNSQHYTLREKRLKGTTAMSIKTLEDRGYNVVPIDLDLWKRCPDFEKIPFIMEQIKQKTDYMEKMSDIS